MTTAQQDQAISALVSAYEIIGEAFPYPDWDVVACNLDAQSGPHSRAVALMRAPFDGPAGMVPADVVEEEVRIYQAGLLALAQQDPALRGRRLHCRTVRKAGKTFLVIVETLNP